ncbi:hypothetical protein HHE03_15910 [Helicobacter heilmannii]|nr:hypothetical protein HHE03_15910 [Helicobacter heilmannii]
MIKNAEAKQGIPLFGKRVIVEVKRHVKGEDKKCDCYQYGHTTREGSLCSFRLEGEGHTWQKIKSCKNIQNLKMGSWGNIRGSNHPYYDALYKQIRKFEEKHPKTFPNLSIYPYYYF